MISEPKIFHVFFAGLALACVPCAAASTWKVQFAPGPKANRHVLAIESRDLYVDFLLQHAWCVARLRYRGEIIGQPSGATGTVVTWNGKASGTGHGGEGVNEVTLTVDGRDVPLVAGGTARYPATSPETWSGSDVRLRKRSVIGPFDHEAEFHLPASGGHYAVQHRYTVNAAWPAGKITGYAYAFMHMMPTAFTAWSYRKADGTAKQGTMLGKTGLVFDREPFVSLVCYAPEKNVGVAYVYPREYELHNHLLDRGDEDRKFRAAFVQREGYAVGDTFSYEMKVVPFTATDATWRNAAGALASASPNFP